MLITFDDPRKFEGHNIWWMSFPKIESRKPVMNPFGPPPRYKVGDKVKFIHRPERVREVLKVEWHMHRYQWVYIVETTASDSGKIFEPYCLKTS